MNGRRHNIDTTARLALRPPEAAASIGVSEGTLRKWIDEGVIPFVRIGSCLLLPVDSLRSWLTQRATASPAEDGTERIRE